MRLIIIDGHPSWFGSMAAQLELQHAPAHVDAWLDFCRYESMYDVGTINI